MYIERDAYKKCRKYCHSQNSFSEFSRKNDSDYP